MKRRTRWSPVRWMSTVVMAWLLLPMMFGAESCPETGHADSNPWVQDEDVPLRIAAKRALRVGPGTAMSVTLEDSTELWGVYLGRTQLDDDAYRVRLEAWRLRTPEAPGLQAPIELVHGDGSVEQASFLGFTYRALEVERGSPPRRTRVPFSHFRVLRVADGGEWTTDALAALDARGDLPSREALRIGRHPYRTWTSAGGFGIGEQFGMSFDDTALVAVDRVRWVEVPTVHSNSALGVVAGIAVGAVIVIAIIEASRPRIEASQCESTGTPLLWSRTAEPGMLDFDTRAGTFVEPARADSAGGMGGASDGDLALRGAR